MVACAVVARIRLHLATHPDSRADLSGFYLVLGRVPICHMFLLDSVIHCSLFLAEYARTHVSCMNLGVSLHGPSGNPVS
jgi:hypothetical protein